jgi:CheY-like chemotaxis protein
VLVVEAAPRFIEDLTDQLTSLGYRFVIARSGTEALEKARRLQPGAIFLNPLLPLLSGWDVLTLLKADAATRQLPVIMTATQADKDQAFSNRADDFLSLPVQQQVLQQILTRFCAKPQVSPSGRSVSQSARTDTLTILRLVTSHPSPFPGVETQGGNHSLLGLKHKGEINYQILEADDLEQAELLARIWQPDVVLLDRGIPDPVAYLKQLTQHPSLKSLPLVTLDGITTQEANQVTGLSVFPCLTPAQELGTGALLSVLQIAAGISWQPSLLVVNFATLPDLQSDSSLLPGVETQGGTHSSGVSLGSEWLQALIQYLQTGGLRAVMPRSWAEVLQQIRQQNVDLLLICLGDSRLDPGVLAALKALEKQHDVPPVLVLQRLSQDEFTQQFHYDKERNEEDTPTPPARVGERFSSPATDQSDVVESLETVLGAIATQILPPSLSMEELLSEINQALAVNRSEL